MKQSCYVQSCACLHLFVKAVKIADGLLLFARQKLAQQVVQLPDLNKELRTVNLSVNVSRENV